MPAALTFAGGSSSVSLAIGYVGFALAASRLSLPADTPSCISERWNPHLCSVLGLPSTLLDSVRIY